MYIFSPWEFDFNPFSYICDPHYIILDGGVRMPPKLSTLGREVFLKYGMIAQGKFKENQAADVFGNS